jgi:hypothetical protein
MAPGEVKMRKDVLLKMYVQKNWLQEYIKSYRRLDGNIAGLCVA